MTDAARLVPYAEISIINILFTRGNEEGTKRERRGLLYEERWVFDVAPR